MEFIKKGDYNGQSYTRPFTEVGRRHANTLAESAAGVLRAEIERAGGELADSRGTGNGLEPERGGTRAEGVRVVQRESGQNTADDSGLNTPQFSRTASPAKGDINLEKLYNKDGEFDYEAVKEIAGRIGSGELKITRLNPREEQGRIAGGRRNVEASIIAGAEARTNQAESRDSRPTRKEKLAHNRRVESHLEKYAKNEGIWFDYDDFVSKHKYLANGQEAHVYEDRDIKFVVKAVDYNFNNGGLSPLDFIDNRISLFNHLFPATKYELTGFTRDNDGRFRFILRQPFITGKPPHPSKRRSYMKQVLGLTSESLTPEQYVNSDYHIWDLHLENVIQSESGEVFVIDALLELNTPERYLDGTRNYADFGIAGTGESAKLKKALTDIQPNHQTKTGEEVAELSKDRLFQWLSNVNENDVSKVARENGKPDARRQFSPNLTATQINPTFSRADLGASLSDTNIAKILPDLNKVSKVVDSNGGAFTTRSDRIQVWDI